MEYWNIGHEIQMMSGLKVRMRARQIKIGLIPSTPVFHHSSIPVP
jgi:hypothetical protein